ncbi:hypothetical protein GFS24_10320 [Chitinophaga sp. SYP-B3965]|uniref:phage virion morphogenesis protein n=1 Tax=Chitinophaga sp. SYP-B3965 TaxID=2663120 RepID=UPI0012995C18|nr:phage virion morphogenesis protein [Chitinophaga sp. SYP-B3965]MRG45512.1 hypothetical protein [Chitinophaga sp. SYP-B3965]
MIRTAQEINIMAENNNTPDFLRIAEELISDLTVYASVTALNFFKESFEVQGWRDTGLTPWPSRADNDGTRSILVKSGHLRDSIRIVERGSGRVVFGTNAPYAEVHNSGGVISVRITPKARRFFWFMYDKTGKDHWKYMALTKKDQLTINIPKRQFIGESRALNEKLEDWVVNEISNRFNTL